MPLPRRKRSLSSRRSLTLRADESARPASVVGAQHVLGCSAGLCSGFFNDQLLTTTLYHRAQWLEHRVRAGAFQQLIVSGAFDVLPLKTQAGAP